MRVSSKPQVPDGIIFLFGDRNLHLSSRSLAVWLPGTMGADARERFPDYEHARTCQKPCVLLRACVHLFVQLDVYLLWLLFTYPKLLISRTRTVLNRSRVKKSRFNNCCLLLVYGWLLLASVCSWAYATLSRIGKTLWRTHNSRGNITRSFLTRVARISGLGLSPINIF